MDYLKKVLEQTPTRFWINNPDMQEMAQAISKGARNATTNPAYCAKLLKAEPVYIRGIIDSIIPLSKDDNIVADMVYQAVSKRIMEQFYGIYRESRGRDGYVTIQYDPREEENFAAIVNAAQIHRKSGENYMAKIPVTKEGLKAIEIVLQIGIPVCATEVFSISQAVYVCELHQRVCMETGTDVPMYVTHITGIFDDYLQRFAKLDKIAINSEIIAQAGCIVGRRQFHILKDRGFKAVMLGGGARGIHHFSEFIGGRMDATLNWKTLEELDDKEDEPINRIDAIPAENIIEELCEKLPDFKKAYEEKGLTVDEFADFGPVKLFKNNFLEGYYILLAEICTRRAQRLKWGI